MNAQQPAGAPTGFPCRLGDFELWSKLGEGGSGVVYAARWGHRDVALKVLHPALVATGRERERFFAEAKLLSEIAHPGVVKVLGFGALPDGRPYLAMEMLAGESLATRLTRGPLPMTEALGLFGQIANAVSALHERGLVHRDLKPENVMLVSGGSYAVLLDFGIAKELDAPASTVTQDGGVRGTPAYMAPERFFGQPATTHSDIYELAVTLFAMLVGRLPWDAVTDPEARLNPRSPSSLGVPLPPQLEVVISRALSTRPESRPLTAAAFFEQVEQSAGSAGRQMRRTADMAAASPRQTVDLAGAPVAQTAAAAPSNPGLQHPSWQHAPTVPATPPSMLGTAPTVAAPPSRRPIWPLVVAGLGTAAFIALIVVLALQSGGDSDDAPAAAAAPAADDPAPEAAEPLAPVPLAAPTSGLVASPAAVRSAAATGMAAAARHHPADTGFLIAIRVRDLLDNKLLGELIRSQKTNPELAPLIVMGELCKFDPFADLDWVSIGMVADDEVDVTLSGTFDRKAVDSCAATMEGERAMTWIDDRTLLFTTRAGVAADWLAARKQGRGSLAERAGADLAAVDRTATVWFAGQPADAFGTMGSGELPAPQAAFGAVALTSDLALDVWVRYADSAEVAKAQAAIDKELEEVKALLGDLKVERDGNRLHLTTRLSSMLTTMIAGMVADELAKP